MILLEEKEIIENKTEYINTIAHKQLALNRLDSLLTYHIENNNLNYYLIGLKILLNII
mgnify:CR=1 FL=1